MNLNFKRNLRMGTFFSVLLMLTLPGFAGPEDVTPPRDEEKVEQEKNPAATGPALRRLDEPAASAIEPEISESEAVVVDEDADDEKAPAVDRQVRRVRYEGREEIPFGHQLIPAGERAREAVSILGSTTVDGEVAREAVSILGNTTVNGSTGREAVAVLGNIRVNGEVGGDAVTVLGNVHVNGRVKGEIVSVFGNVELGPEAEVNRGVVIVGGRLARDPAATVGGKVKVVSVPVIGSAPEGLQVWLERCFMLGRPLAFDARLKWAWLIAISVFSFYVLLALLFPRAVEKCAETLEQRPGYSLLAVLLTLLITPVLVVLLAITGIGVILIPFLAAGLFFAGIFGKVVMHAWLGRRITQSFGPGPGSHAAVATLVGSLLVLLLYTVPVLGFLLWKGMEVIGLGVVVYTLILSGRRERPVGQVPVTAPVVPAAVVSPGVTPVPPAPGHGILPLAGSSLGGLKEAAPVMEPAPGMAAPLPPMVDEVALPRAGFWLRVAASLIDAVLVGLLVGFTGTGDYFLLVFAAYCVVLWGLKGTTIGGIVCNLRIVRVDGRKVDWTVAIVRALGGFLSLFVAGLGFIWVAWDPERQSWHDKIAGTTVAQVPKGTPLI